jgi:uncharacterized iron-regulated membrane protein
MEVLATTGAVGFALYFPIYLLLWRRMRRLLKMRLDATSRYDVGLSQSIMITMLVVGLSTPLFLDPMAICILGAMIARLRTIEEGTHKGLPSRSPRFVMYRGA